MAIFAFFTALFVYAPEAHSESQAPSVQPVKPCKTVSPRVYNRALRDRRKVTGHRQHFKHSPVCARRYQDVRRGIRRICKKPLRVITGRVSYFTDGTTASGADASRVEGLAINLNPGTDSGWNNPTTRSWMHRSPTFRVRLLGHVRRTKAVDLGPAGFTHRALDFTAPLARAMHLLPNFPTDAIGRAELLRPGC